MLDKTTIGIAEWLVSEGLQGPSEAELLRGFCERLVAAGVPLTRGNVAQRVVISSAFYQSAGQCSERIVSLGRYALRGVRQPQELYTLLPNDLLETATG
ncbi:MAG TPA: hypothetical protein QF665_01410 [Alphaproteobacteria bacterium]|jgi:hypothetical protein|nr:hypothetical protein [Alphaproteobacteria bacterium]